MNIPYIGFSNDTLNAQPELRAGDNIDCPNCGKQHSVEGSQPPMLLFYKCEERTFLAGINGRSTMGAQSDAKGTIGQ